MTDNRKELLGFHDPSYLELCLDLVRDYDYEVTGVESP
jgi:hypothetical protein